MVLGSGLLILTALANSILQFSMGMGGIDYMDIGTFYIISGVVGVVGQVLFLVGLYQFVMAIGRSGYEKDLLDYLPD